MFEHDPVQLVLTVGAVWLVWNQVAPWAWRVGESCVAMVLKALKVK